MKSNRFFTIYGLFVCVLLGASGCPSAEVEVGEQRPGDGYDPTQVPAVTDPTLKLAFTIGGPKQDTAFCVQPLSATEFMVFGRFPGAMPDQTEQGQSDLFLARYDEERLVWMKQFDAAAMYEGASCALADDGSLIAVGYATGSLGDQTYAGGGCDTFVVKFSQSGELVWTRLLGTRGSELPHGVAVAPTGDIYVTGETNRAFDGDNAGMMDTYLVALDHEGNRRWASTLGSRSDDQGWAVAIAPDGDVLMAATHWGGPSLTADRRDIVIVRFSPSGERRWQKYIGADGKYLYASGIVVGGDGAIAVAGYSWDSTINQDGSVHVAPVDARLYLLEADGTQRWMREVKTEASDAATGVLVDSERNVTLVGFTRGALAGQNATGERDVFLASFTAEGTKRWMWQTGTDTPDMVNGVATGPDGAIWLAGETSGQFGDAPNAGGTDAFILRVADP